MCVCIYISHMRNIKFCKILVLTLDLALRLKVYHISVVLMKFQAGQKNTVLPLRIIKYFISILNYLS